MKLYVFQRSVMCRYSILINYLPGNMVKNLGLAIAWENFEVTEMYPAYKEIAKLQDEKSEYRSFNWSCQTETKHLELFKRDPHAICISKAQT